MAEPLTEDMIDMYMLAASQADVVRTSSLQECSEDDGRFGKTPGGALLLGTRFV